MKTLDPDPHSLKMLDPDPMNPDPQPFFLLYKEPKPTVTLMKILFNEK
jgi:hypothetical protein